MRFPIFLALSFCSLPLLRADIPQDTLLTEDFEKGTQRWKPTDESAWKVIAEPNGNHVFEIISKTSKFKPPFRSPFNIALASDLLVGDFVLTAKVQTTTKAYGHRDLCVLFGYQDPSHFYYVHLGEKTDDHANQIFIVNQADRAKISQKTTAGTPWQDKVWHNIKVERNTKDGVIKVFFDDMEKPAMEAKDTTFAWGQIGLGSFDDTGKFDDLIIKGVHLASRPAKP